MEPDDGKTELFEFIAKKIFEEYQAGEVLPIDDEPYTLGVTLPNGQQLIVKVEDP